MLSSLAAALSASVVAAALEQEVFAPADLAAQHAFWALPAKANRPMNANRKNNFFIVKLYFLMDEMNDRKFSKANLKYDAKNSATLYGKQMPQIALAEL
jgi:hypothetical protein